MVRTYGTVIGSGCSGLPSLSPSCCCLRLNVFFISQVIFSATGGNDEISRLESGVGTSGLGGYLLLCYILLGTVSSCTTTWGGNIGVG